MLFSTRLSIHAKRPLLSFLLRTFSYIYVFNCQNCANSITCLFVCMFVCLLISILFDCMSLMFFSKNTYTINQIVIKRNQSAHKWNNCLHFLRFSSAALRFSSNEAFTHDNSLSVRYLRSLFCCTLKVGICKSHCWTLNINGVMMQNVWAKWGKRTKGFFSKLISLWIQT